MKKKITLALICMLSFSSVSVLAEEKNEKNTQEDFTVNYEAVELQKEKYDGEVLIRIYKFKESKDPYYQFFQVPESINKKIKKDDEQAIDKVTSSLALTYVQTNNMEKLNELFAQFILETPGSDISISDKYSKEFEKNLNSALEYIQSNADTKINLTKDEKRELSSYIQDKEFIKEYFTYKDEKELTNDINDSIDKMFDHWYEHSLPYVLLVIILLLSISSFVYFKRR